MVLPTFVSVRTRRRDRVRHLTIISRGPSSTCAYSMTPMARSKRSKAFGSLVGKSFGAVLRHYREAANWSIEKLSEEAGMDRAYLGQIEQGRRLPTLYIVFRLISALRVDTGKLMGKVGLLVVGDEAHSTGRRHLPEMQCDLCSSRG